MLRRALLVGITITTVAMLMPSGMAQASRLRLLVPSVSSFATDGTRYAAWQASSTAPIVFYDTRTGRQRLVKGACRLDQPGDESPYQTASNGLFLDGCGDLIDARTGHVRHLTGAENLYAWAYVGQHYVMGRTQPNHQCAPTGAEACLALYNIATAAVTVVGLSDLPDLDSTRPTPICPALRKKIGYFEAHTFENFSYDEGMLARAGGPTIEGFGRAVRIERCRGGTTVLHTFREPWHHELRGGVLTWDDAHELVDAETNEANQNFQATVSSYALGSHQRQSLPLPDVHLFLTTETESERRPDGRENPSGTRRLHAQGDHAWAGAGIPQPSQQGRRG